MNVLVENDISIKPKEDGRYLISSTNMISGTEYLIAYFVNGEWSLPGIDSWFEPTPLCELLRSKSKEAVKKRAVGFKNWCEERENDLRLANMDTSLPAITTSRLYELYTNTLK